MPNHDQVARQIAEALEGLQGAFQAVEQVTDPQQAFELATELVDDLGRLEGQAADLRARQVGRIWASETMTLEVLAQRISVRKARAGQLKQRALELANRPEGEQP
ncbi:MAG TPA: hypothetical protein VG276_28265 [Actinomycetes bacterium]|jgi:hypothetical protein|nr:hypothetical protein [Actinomycetes bacterium]